ncbi:2-dehydro-3-deoxyphosphogluconate aldolase / (4S)-4-hydroxy-2-oxoglutarate aldolase [Anaerobranca californiensis DSM 14826]|jgi:2-dehydro-3-deoxyphosphogluconate aldolase/(4S)-4-hydroxy-2-oxoglutarate aldolase|uniref:2-dehydro-3-deoxyphosphogluconate aldolase / (4S)-4-hydroxy-2-oxoglutarate aldolase n=1 Tax=Anaerobranca californiensis DSM 14826 TaxID=1120989 RepID=A0A1M6K7Y9_9FIRM|nr:bifunctional 4-hydroxy-2-oxoglutarate aldolase/2-dehydro-3-deoxy-phosphogluconate aldolase [Anaerobranca californiensis]SHJ55069.1 2-dehydro-3-deoxyphosphogluconate aldolase / (4S)-4-hydroxy-2-oxoglutarate aldolase [Anaerobranca californiensis DSM 14826]
MNNKQKYFQTIIDNGLIAIIRKINQETVNEVIEALSDGGIKVFEITLDTPGSLEIIKDLRKQYNDDIIIGAGTVLDSETARAAILAGAEFVFTPNINLDVIKLANRYGKLIVPGAMTPTEIVNAYEAGADLIKVFPAGILGSSYIKAIKGPLAHIPIIPTGGINLENAREFIKAGAAALGIGGELVDEKVIKEKNFNLLKKTASKYIEIIKKELK